MWTKHRPTNEYDIGVTYVNRWNCHLRFAVGICPSPSSEQVLNGFRACSTVRHQLAIVTVDNLFPCSQRDYAWMSLHLIHSIKMSIEWRLSADMFNVYPFDWRKTCTALSQIIKTHGQLTAAGIVHRDSSIYLRMNRICQSVSLTSRVCTLLNFPHANRFSANSVQPRTTCSIEFAMRPSFQHRRNIWSELKLQNFNRSALWTTFNFVRNRFFFLDHSDAARTRWNEENEKRKTGIAHRWRTRQNKHEISSCCLRHSIKHATWTPQPPGNARALIGRACNAWPLIRECDCSLMQISYMVCRQATP